MNIKKLFIDEINKKVNDVYCDFSQMIKKHNLILVNPDGGTYFRIDYDLPKNSEKFITAETENIKNDIEQFFKNADIQISDVSMNSITNDTTSFVFAIQDNSLKNEIDETSIDNAINGAIIKTLYGKAIIEKYDMLNSENPFLSIINDKDAVSMLRGNTLLPDEIRRGFVMEMTTLTSIQKSILLNNPNESKVDSKAYQDKNSLTGLVKALQEEHKEDLAEKTIEKKSSARKNR